MKREWGTTMQYIICSSPRTGSSLLAHTMVAMGVGNPREFLNPAMTKYFSLCGVEHFMKPTPDAYIDRLKREHTVNDVFAIKTHYTDLARVPDIFNNVGALFPNAKFIAVTRRNVLRQALSASRAVQTNAWNAYEPEQKKPRFNPCAVLKHVVHILGELERWEAFFKSNGIRPLRIVYEDLDADYYNTVERVTSFLGVSGSIPPPPLKKQADATTEEWVSRFMSSFEGRGLVGRVVQRLSRRW